MSLSNLYFFNGVDLLKFDAHKTPEFKQRNTVDWVLYGNDDEWKNRYPDYLIHLYNSSPKNNAIINKKCSYIKGQGLNFGGAGLSLQDKIQLGGFVAKLEDSKVFERSVSDLSIFGGFANEMVFNKGGNKVEPYHIDFSNIRVSKPVWNEELQDWNRPTYYYTSDWSSRKPHNNEDFVEFEEFNPNETPDKNKRYLFYYKEYRPDLGVYPLPDYLASVPYIAADYEISNFTINNVKNGFTSGYLINFYNGDPTEEQKRDIVANFDAVLHGTDNAGKSIKSFNEDKDSAVDITPLNANGQDDRFINLNNTIRDEIYTGHGVDPVIAGLKGDSGWSNNADEKRVAVEEWQNSYVDSKQKIFEDYFTNVAHFNDIKGKVEIVKTLSMPKQFSEQTLMQISTSDELRSMAGLPVSKVERNLVSDALASLSPLVANKVLDSMTITEIRSLINLEATKEKRTTIEMSKEEYFESYTDYPKGATSNAKRALEWADNNGWGSCGTDVGKIRANQLAKREPISLETIKRAFSFLSRHEQNKDVPYSEGCGGLMYDAWGGDAMKRYAKAKIKKVEDEKLVQQFTNCGLNDDELEFIDSRQVPIWGTEDAFSKEQEYKQEFATKIEISILKLLIGGANPSDIQKSLKISEEKYNESIVNLTEEGYLTDDGDITQSGEEESKKDEIFVVYKYVKRNDVSGGDIIDTTRDFCKNMVRQSRTRSWTLEEIKLMNNGMGLDVFTSRGGWRTIERTNRHVPFCRHIWEQRLVRRR